MHRITTRRHRLRHTRTLLPHRQKNSSLLPSPNQKQTRKSRHRLPRSQSEGERQRRKNDARRRHHRRRSATRGRLQTIKRRIFCRRKSETSLRHIEMGPVRQQQSRRPLGPPHPHHQHNLQPNRPRASLPLRRHRCRHQHRPQRQSTPHRARRPHAQTPTARCPFQQPKARARQPTRPNCETASTSNLLLSRVGSLAISSR